MKTKEDAMHDITNCQGKLYEINKKTLEVHYYINKYVPNVLPDVLPLIEAYNKTNNLNYLLDYFLKNKSKVTLYDIYYLLIYKDYEYNNYEDTDLFSGSWYKDLENELSGYYDVLETYGHLSKQVLDKENLSISVILRSFLLSIKDYDDYLSHTWIRGLKTERDSDIFTGRSHHSEIKSAMLDCLVVEFDRFISNVYVYVISQSDIVSH